MFMYVCLSFWKDGGFFLFFWIIFVCMIFVMVLFFRLFLLNGIGFEELLGVFLYVNIWLSCLECCFVICGIFEEVCRFFFII